MRAFYNICMVAALFCVLVAGAQAIDVNVSVYKHNFTSNETIPSIVTNMSEGAYYSQKATFYQYMKPGEPSELGNNNVTWLFAHEDEVFNMTNVNTTSNSVYIGHWWPPQKGGGYEELWFNGSSYNITAPDGTVVEGTWNRTYHYEYEQLGTYISRWHAEPLPGAEIVESTFWINGSKMYGPTNFTENTSVWSRNPAYVTLDYYENNTHAAHDWFTIDMPWTDGPVVTPDPDGSDAYGTVGTSATSDTGPEGTPTATVTSTGPGDTATLTAAPTDEATATPGGDGNASAAPAGGDSFPYLWLLALLALIVLLLVLFLALRRRKDGEDA
jgi:hypothetical protein